MLFSIKLFDINEDRKHIFTATNPNTQQPVTVIMFLAATLPINSPTCFQLFNILMRECLAAIGYQQVRDNYYNPNKQIVKIPQHKMVVWPGFLTAIHEFDEGPLMMIDISHKLLREETVLEQMDQLRKRNSATAHSEMMKKIVGQIVMTKYNNKTYKIDDIDFTKTVKDTFDKRGEPTTYLQYFVDTYAINISRTDQPLLVHRAKPREQRQRRLESGDQASKDEIQIVHLVPELCYLTGLSDDMKTDFRIMKDIAVHTRIGPDVREQRMLAFMKDIQTHQQVKENLEKWSMRFDPKLLEIEGRTLDAEKIVMAGGPLPPHNPSAAEWSGKMRGQRLLVSKPIKDWMIIYAGRELQVANSLKQALVTSNKQLGMGDVPPAMIQLDSNTVPSYTNAIKANAKESTMMVICILPGLKKDLYDAIKKLCCVERPVPSQCVLSKTLMKQQMIMSVAGKIAMQLNCKMGGELWAVDVPLKELMVVGYDTYHDSACKGQSVGGFIASTNKNLTKYYSTITRQTSHQELASQLKRCMVNALKEWRALNNDRLPDRIVYFRDGVGDGQIPQVQEHEIRQLLEAFKDYGGEDYATRVKWCFVIVTKRVNTRMFARQGGKLANPDPGTIADTGVTRPERYDFYLVSQSVRQGTVTPAAFNVIWDSSGLKPDHLQRLSYKLTHLYFNWPGTIRVPAPCQYAHKLAFLVGQNLHQNPHPSLSHNLFYL